MPLLTLSRGIKRLVIIITVIMQDNVMDGTVAPAFFLPFPILFSPQYVTGNAKVAGRQRLWEATYKLHSHSVN